MQSPDLARYRGSALLTDLYQLTMAYGYWKTRTHEKEARTLLARLEKDKADKVRA